MHKGNIKARHKIKGFLRQRNPSFSILNIPRWVQKDIEPTKILSPWSAQKRGYKHLDCSSKTSVEKNLDFKGNEIVKKQLLSDYQKVSKKIFCMWIGIRQYGKPWNSTDLNSLWSS